MEIIPKEVQRSNKRLGEALGWNPHGEPLYKWIWVNTWEHFMRDIQGYEHTANPATGLIELAPIYKRRRMVPNLDDPQSPHRDRWHVGHWHDCGPEYGWRQQFGSEALWSRFGFYSMTDIWSPQGQLPSDTITEGLIIRVKQFRETTLADAREYIAEQITKRENDQQNRMADAIKDAMTAFGTLPGSKAGSVSFPTPDKLIQPPAAAGN